jgi:hypothetical protein
VEEGLVGLLVSLRMEEGGSGNEGRGWGKR